MKVIRESYLKRREGGFWRLTNVRVISQKIVIARMTIDEISMKSTM